MSKKSNKIKFKVFLLLLFWFFETVIHFVPLMS